jgi:hypothetical protein
MSDKKFKAVLDTDGKGGNIKYIRPSLLAAEGITGVVAEGIYEGTVPNNFDKNKNDYRILAADGSLTILNSTGSLANQLARVSTGSFVRVTYNGMEKIKKGNMAGKKAHAFLVEVAE